MGKKDAMTFITWNLLAGVIGYLFYQLLGLNSFESLFAFPTLEEITAVYIIIAVCMGILGSFIAVLIGLTMKGIGYGDGKNICR